MTFIIMKGFKRKTLAEPQFTFVVCTPEPPAIERTLREDLGTTTIFVHQLPYQSQSMKTRDKIVSKKNFELQRMSIIPRLS